MKLRAFLIVSLASRCLFPETVLPPLGPQGIGTPEFIKRVVEEYPWVTGSGVAASMQLYMERDPAFIPEMVKHPQFIELDRDRPPLLTIHVERAHQVKERVYVLSKATLASIQKQIIALLEELQPSPSESLPQALDHHIQERLAVITRADAKGILTGMINCLPPKSRATFFKMADLNELLESLSQSPELTDERLREHFQGRAHGITAEEISRDGLLSRVRQILNHETELLGLLRARWFLENLSEPELSELEESKKALRLLVGKAPSESFDIDGSEAGKVEEFFASLTELVSADSKEKLNKTKQTLSRIQTTWREAEKTLVEKEVVRGIPYFTLREMPPHLGVHRSAFNGDCGSRDDYPFLYSPLERTFFVFDAAGEAIGYFGATLLHTNRELTLYVHDVTGVHLPQEIRDAAVNAVFQVLPAFGVKKMTIGITGYLVYNLPGPAEQVKNDYIDVPLREFFEKNAAAPHGDRPQDNVHSRVFNPEPNLSRTIMARVEGVHPIFAKPNKPKTPREKLLALLDLTRGQENTLIDLSFLELSAKEQNRILSTLNNRKRWRLEQYYAEVAKLFEEYGIGLSEKFIKKHEAYFIRGHLSCGNILQEQDPAFNARTVLFTIAALKRGDRDLGYEIVSQNPAFFVDSERFREYLERIPLADEEQLAKVSLLRDAGVNPTLIASTNERLLELMQIKDPSLKLWAIVEWGTRNGYRPPPPEGLIRALGKALNNYKHETDELSELASKILTRMRVEDPDILKQLRRSVKDEENMEIAYRAVIVLLRNGVERAEIEKMIGKNKHRKDLLERIKTVTVRGIQMGRGQNGGCLSDLRVLAEN